MYKRTPGEMRSVFQRFDYMNLPDPANNKPEGILKTDLHFLDFLYDDR